LNRLKPWIDGARPRTLPAAVAPVAVGTAAASIDGSIIWWRAVAAMIVALALQVATNYVNDYADGQRGTDDTRVGPTRLVASGQATATQVKVAAVVSFAVAGLAGGALALAIGPELFVVGAASMLAGWAYTGGPRPYGYYGLGEVFVFVFFGLVATVGSTYVQIESITALSVLAAVPMGLLAVALLVINNLRDIPTDSVTGKKTLAVRIGDRPTRWMYAALMAVAAAFIVACAAVEPWAALGLVGLAPAIAPIRSVLDGAGGLELIATLAATGKVQMATGFMLALGLVLAGG
jgi:1,4-dihydroxy-2-naphthoate octaprenyltransferase